MFYNLIPARLVEALTAKYDDAPMEPLCICNGVLRSGSTWAFNVCRELYHEAKPELADRIISTYLNPQPLEELIRDHWAGLRAPTIIKAHLPGPLALRAIMGGTAFGVCTYRDPRDCVASDMAFMDCPFETSLKRISSTFAPLRFYRSTPNILLVCYEEMMIDRCKQIRRIAEHLGLAIAEAAIARIDDKTNPQSSEKICARLRTTSSPEVLELDGHRVDPKTQLHHNHLRGGTVGRWRGELSEDQIVRLDQQFAPVLCELGYIKDACQPSISLDTNSSVMHNNRGVDLGNAGLLDEAVEQFRRALQLAPDDAEVYGNLGVVLLKLDRHREAADVYTTAVGLQPGSAQAWCNLGVALRSTGRPEQAIDAYARALELMPDSAETHLNMGVALEAAGKREDAIAAYHRAIAIDPKLANGQFNLANALAADNDYEAAIAAYRKAIQISPNFIAAHTNLGKALMRLNKIDEAMSSYNRAIEIDPQSVHPRWNRSLALLLQGDYEQGWAEYEWRHRQLLQGSQRFRQPQWNGEPIQGRIILLHADQGLGDAVQMARYVPLVSDRGARVILQCHRELSELFKTLRGVDQLLCLGDPLPAFEVHCPLMSLPRAFGTRLDSIPETMPYLSADPQRVEQWRARLAPPNGRRIALVWAGAPEHQYDRQRSVHFAAFRPLLGKPGLQFFSLQKGAAADQIKDSSADYGLIDHTGLLINYADTAAFILQMDLVISVDTSVAHVAAAIGKPVWMLLPFAPDWRWFLDRADSPWYPTMRLFRQETPNDWTRVIQQLAHALDTEISQLIHNEQAKATDVARTAE